MSLSTLKDIFGFGVVTKINNEIKSKQLDAMKQCKVGLEMHFKDSGGENDDTKDNRRLKRRSIRRHFVCWYAKLAV